MYLRAGRIRFPTISQSFILLLLPWFLIPALATISGKDTWTSLRTQGERPILNRCSSRWSDYVANLSAYTMPYHYPYLYLCETALASGRTIALVWFWVSVSLNQEAAAVFPHESAWSCETCADAQQKPAARFDEISVFTVSHHRYVYVDGGRVSKHSVWLMYTWSSSTMYAVSDMGCHSQPKGMPLTVLK